MAVMLDLRVRPEAETEESWVCKQHLNTMPCQAHISYIYQNEMKKLTTALTFFIFNSSLLGKSMGETNCLP